MITSLSNSEVACRLCGSLHTAEFFHDDSRKYRTCSSCGLIFVPSDFHVAFEEEKRRYSKHTNTKDSRQYVQYLSGIAIDALSLTVGSPGVLDFGSGPEHVLTDIFNSMGARCVPHDPLYDLRARDEPAQFDIVVACESIEHVRNLSLELEFISKVLKPTGLAYVRTQLYDSVTDFGSWWYKVDPTHINFFCKKAMEEMAKLLARKVLRTNGKDTTVIG